MLSIRLMTAADVPLGMRLKEQAGWNQTEADWRRYLELQADGCFVAELNGRTVGTAATSIFGAVAWIALVLVDETVRGRGIGTALMQHALAFLDARHIPTVRLDATHLGQPVYEKLGFVGEYELVRYEDVLPAGPAVTGVEPAPPEVWPELVELDRSVTGADRRRWLQRLFAEWPEAVRVVRGPEGVRGFLTARRGSRAVHMGPCLGMGTSGELLLADAWQRLGGQRVILDVVTDHAAARALPERLGWPVRRRFLRMRRGPAVVERIGEMWVSSGPEKG
jgi:GNAT superfamily N-acetyltransferase